MSSPHSLSEAWIETGAAALPAQALPRSPHSLSEAWIETRNAATTPGEVYVFASFIE